MEIVKISKTLAAIDSLPFNVALNLNKLSCNFQRHVEIKRIKSYTKNVVFILKRLCLKMIYCRLCFFIFLLEQVCSKISRQKWNQDSSR